MQERCDGGEVLDRLEELNVYSEQEAAGVIRSLCIALDHVHKCGVIHRDIKVRSHPTLPTCDSSHVAGREYSLC